MVNSIYFCLSGYQKKLLTHLLDSVKDMEKDINYLASIKIYEKRGFVEVINDYKKKL